MSVQAKPSKQSAARTVVLMLAALVAIGVALATADRWTRGAQSGPESSSYTTDSNGLAAYAELLTREGHRVHQLREPLGEAELDPSATLFVLDAALDAEDAEAVQRFVQAGGRLVAGGRDPEWLRMIVADPPLWGPSPAGEQRPLAPVSEVAGVQRAVSTGEGVWSDTGPALPVLGGEYGSLLAVSERVVFLASAGVLHNRVLDEADNAALGLAIAGPAGDVLFAEEPHGFGVGQGFSAIPTGVRWAMFGLALAAVVWMAGRARNLGPPEDADRQLAPPRRLYVEAIASTLSKTKRRAEAVAPLQRAARQRVARIMGLAADADPGAVQAAAIKLGLTEREAASIVTPPTDDGAVVEAGRAFARLETMSR